MPRFPSILALAPLLAACAPLEPERRGLDPPATLAELEALQAMADDHTERPVHRLAARFAAVELAGHLDPAVLSEADQPTATALATSLGEAVLPLLHNRSLRGHDLPVRALAAAPDLSRVAASSESGQLIIWDTATGDASWRRADLWGVSTLAVSPDGRWLAAGADYEPWVAVYDLATGQLVSVSRVRAPEEVARPTAEEQGDGGVRERGHSTTEGTIYLEEPVEEGISALTWADADHVLVTPRKGPVVEIEAATGSVEPLALPPPEVPEDDAMATADALMPNGRWMRTALKPLAGGAGALGGFQDGTVRLLRPDGSTVAFPGGAAKPVAIDPAGRWLVTGGLGGAWVRALPEGRVVFSITDVPAHIEQAAISPDGTTLVTAWDGGIMRAHDLPSGAALASWQMEPTGPTATAWSPDGTVFVVGDRLGQLQFLDPRTGTLTAHSRAHVGEVGDLAAHPEGGTVWSTGEDGAVRGWAFDGAAAGELEVGHAYSRLSWSPSGDRLLLDRGARVTVVDPTGQRPDLDLDGLQASSPVAAFAAQGRQLLVPRQEGVVELYDLEEDALIATLRGPERPVLDIDVSPGGHLAAMSSSGTVALWDLESRALLWAPEARASAFRRLGFGDDALLVLSTTSDTVLWSLPLTAPEDRLAAALATTALRLCRGTRTVVAVNPPPAEAFAPAQRCEGAAAW